VEYYLDYDTRQKCYYLAPFKVEKGKTYLIRFEKRFEADNYLKLLNSQKVDSPLIDSENYNFIEEIVEQKTVVKIFSPKKKPA